MRLLNTSCESKHGRFLRSQLEDRVIGQSDAIDALVSVYEKFKSGLYDKRRPIASVLLLGPTGCGKTRLAEAFTESIHRGINQILKIDCGEFQHSHDIEKLKGSPPGYLGHRETKPAINCERIRELQGEEGFAILLFDEIEKASDALWHLMLGILDKGTLTLGTNEQVDLTKTVILMTSNAGSGEMAFALGDRVGFGSNASKTAVNDAEIAGIGVKAAKRKFTAEFINRLDHIVGCNALTREQTSRVIELEIKLLQNKLLLQCDQPLLFKVSDSVKNALLERSYDPKYNARNVRREIEKRIQVPLARVLNSGQCRSDEYVLVHADSSGEFLFSAC